MLNPEDVAHRLRERGQRLTPQRLAVVEAVAGGQGRLSASQVYERARRIAPEIGLATVYRTLGLLADVGAIRRVHMDDHCGGYAPASLRHVHHVICRSCGCVSEFEGCDISSVVRSAARQTGFRIDDHWLGLVGTCDECLAQEGGGQG
jgi:Fur family ferric uptake transcriptional regulator